MESKAPNNLLLLIIILFEKCLTASMKIIHIKIEIGIIIFQVMRMFLKVILSIKMINIVSLKVVKTVGNILT